MPQQDFEAGEVDEAEIVVDMVFPSGDKAAEVVEPGEQPLHISTSFIATQRSPVLGFGPVAAVGRNQLDAVFGGQLAVQSVRVVCLVADQPCGQLIEEASGKGFLNKRALRRASALDRYGERKIVISGDSDIFVPLPRRVGPTASPLFSRSRRLHPRTPRLDRACPARARARQAV